jgi:hypothetical protein
MIHKLALKIWHMAQITSPMRNIPPLKSLKTLHITNNTQFIVRDIGFGKSGFVKFIISVKVGS